MTEEDLAQRLKAKIRGFVDLGAAQTTVEKAKAGSLKVGDMVSWNNSGGRASGKITKVVTDGTINIPDSSFTVEGTEENPAAPLRLYDGEDPTDTLVGHKFSALTKLAGYAPKKDEDEDAKGDMEDEDEDEKREQDAAYDNNSLADALAGTKSAFPSQPDEKIIGDAEGEGEGEGAGGSCRAARRSWWETTSRRRLGRPPSRPASRRACGARRGGAGGLA